MLTIYSGFLIAEPFEHFINAFPRGEINMNKKLLAIGFGLVALLLLWSGISIYPDWLWFENLGFSPVFWTMLLSKFGFGLLIWLLLMVILIANLYAARRLSPGDGPGEACRAVQRGQGQSADLRPLA